MSLSSVCSWCSNSSVILSIWPCTVSNRAVNLAKGAALPRSFSHHDRSRRTSSSDTEKPRMVVTIPRKESPAGPTSLLRTPCNMPCEISCNSACAAEPKETMEFVSPISTSSIRLRISAPTGASAFSSGTIAFASAGSGRIVRLTSSTSASAASAFWRILSDMVVLLLVVAIRADALALQPVPQHVNFNRQITTVIQQQLLGPGGEIALQIIQKRQVILPRPAIAVAAVDIGEFHRRVLGPQQINRHVFARRRQVAGVFLDGTKQVARGGLNRSTRLSSCRSPARLIASDIATRCFSASSTARATRSVWNRSTPSALLSFKGSS